MDFKDIKVKFKTTLQGFDMFIPEEPIITEGLYHGSSKRISLFEYGFGGTHTSNNLNDNFFFSNKIQVAVDYSRESFKSSFEHIDHEDLFSLYLEETPVVIDLETREDLLINIYNFDKRHQIASDIAEDNLHVMETKLTFNSPLIIDAKYSGIDVLDKNYVIDALTGAMKYLPHNPDNPSIGDVHEAFSVYNEELFEHTFILLDCDGIIIKNVNDSVGDASSIYQDVYIALHPYQIAITDYFNSKKLLDEHNL